MCSSGERSENTITTDYHMLDAEYIHDVILDSIYSDMGCGLFSGCMASWEK